MGVETALIGGAIAAPIVGGIMGGEAARKERKAADRARAAALAQFAGIEVPGISEQELALIAPEFIGEYQPMLEESIEAGPSRMEEIELDPRLREAQMQALSRMAELGEGGLTPGDVAAMRSMQREVARQEEARQGAIMQEMARRGMGGSGLELAARVASSQAAAERGAERADVMTQMAQQRALQAIGQAGQLGGQIRGQEFGEQADIAAAADAIARFNAQNQQAMMARNIEAQRQAQLRNISERQRLSEQEAAIRNYQQEANKRLIEQQFQQQMQLASGRAGQYAGQAAGAEAAAQRAGQMWSGIGTGVGTGLGAIAGGMARRPAQTQTPDTVSTQVIRPGDEIQARNIDPRLYGDRVYT